MWRSRHSSLGPVLAITLFLLAVNVGAAWAAVLRTVPEPVPGEYIVVLVEDAVRESGSSFSSLPTVADVAAEVQTRHGASIQFVYEGALPGFAARLSADAVAALLRDPRVDYVEENGRIRAFATQNNATWGLDRIDQRDRPLNSTYVYNTTASNVHAYVVDTGIRASHNDFGGRVSGGYTAIQDGRGTTDCNGHGTHVAGTIGGSTWGVAKAVRLHPVRVLDCSGNGTTAGVIAGVNWVRNNHVKPAVANMSLGGGASSSLDQAVSSAISAGVSFVVAAGNENQNACNTSPARVGAALTVGSTTSSDTRSSFSNWGSCLDLFAPGSSITSAWYNSNSATQTISGTSMAAPHVAGVAALYLATHTSASPATVANAINSTASTGRVSNPGSGSPNRLLYSLLEGGGGGGGGGGDCEGSGSAGNLSGSAGTQLRYTFQVPSCASQLTVRISGGSGDADLYVRYGAQPTTSTWDCRPYLYGNNETCTFSNPNSGTWHIMVRGYTSFSGVTLSAEYE